MNALSVLFSILKADFLERTRRFSFLATLCMVLYLGYAVNTGQILIKLSGSYRGIYNAAWVGSLMAVVITFILGLIGFFLVKNTIERDEQSGVGQILATTSITRPQYLLGKWLSNFVVLTTLVAILALAAIFMQLIQREEAQIQIWPLVAPILLIALPMMALVSAFAVFFETVPWLKGGFGNLVYFFVFLFLFLVGIFLPQFPWLDVVGFSLVGSSMRAAASAAIPGYEDSFVFSMISDKPLQTFVWTGLDWSAALIFQRLVWLVLAMGVVLLGAVFFHRFDTHRYDGQQHAGAGLLRRLLRHVMKAVPVEGRSAEDALPEAADSGHFVAARLTPIAYTRRFHPNILRLVGLETLLLVKGLRWYWLAGAALLWLGSVFAPSEILRKFAFMFISIWPVLLWSKMGEREARYQAGSLVFQAAYPLARMLAPAWLAGVLVTAILESGVLLGRLIHAEPVCLLPWTLSVLFIPTLALALGVWSCSSRAFEAVYPILWYLGPFNPQNGLVIIDFLGTHAQASVITSPVWFAGAILLLLLLSCLGRQRQIMVSY